MRYAMAGLEPETKVTQSRVHRKRALKERRALKAANLAPSAPWSKVVRGAYNDGFRRGLIVGLLIGAISIALLAVVVSGRIIAAL